MSHSRMNWLREVVLTRSGRFTRQAKAINNIDARVIVLLMAALGLARMFVPVAQAGEPPLPKLKTETEEAFERYVKLTEARNQGELKRGAGLLWVDGLPVGQRAAAYAALKQGEVKMQKLEILDNGKPIACPGGMIHHWVGAVFIPGAKLGDVVAHGRPRQRRLRAKRSGFTDKRHSHGAWMDDQRLCDRHTEGNADVHAASDAKSSRSASSQPLISSCSLGI